MTTSILERIRNTWILRLKLKPGTREILHVVYERILQLRVGHLALGAALPQLILQNLKLLLPQVLLLLHVHQPLTYSLLHLRHIWEGGTATKTTFRMKIRGTGSFGVLLCLYLAHSCLM